ncbi:hypothetical protein OQA88_5531 [Cercophora sp. LCS_1]
MDFLNELESMATTLSTQSADEPDTPTLHRWQNLFSYTPSEALTALKAHRASLDPSPVTDAHWALVRTEKESRGHDRESYAHACILLRQAPVTTGTVSKPTSPKPSKYLVKLEGQLSSPDTIRDMAGLDICPPEKKGHDDDGNPVTFCIIDSVTKDTLARQVEATFIRYSIAGKDLCSWSVAPMLGVDTTMPQLRVDKVVPISPKQFEYPVWYFFYGTLGDPEVLGRLFGRVVEKGEYRQAKVVGGGLTTWGGKYKALVDKVGGVVEGVAFLVKSREEEEALRVYETDRYEVVRCGILVEGGVAMGLTFRFVGA